MFVFIVIIIIIFGPLILFINIFGENGLTAYIIFGTMVVVLWIVAGAVKNTNVSRSGKQKSQHRKRIPTNKKYKNNVTFKKEPTINLGQPSGASGFTSFYEEDDSGDYEIDGIEVTEEEFVLHSMLMDEEEERKKDDGYEDDSDYSWETHCEYCGELLEDCVCDHRHESHEAISLWDCGCDEKEDNDDRRDRLCDFDEFRS